MTSRIITADDLDLEIAAVDQTLDAAEEAEVASAFPVGIENAPDLTGGGMVGGVKVQKGRAAAIRAWMWNGTETSLTLAWTVDGKGHDGGRRYLQKKHCLCCGDSGFRTRYCTKCRRDVCNRCRNSTVSSQIIPAFYLRLQDVPYPQHVYGNIDCFLPSCIRRGIIGFQTEEEMRMHGRSRHGEEYRSWIEVKQSSRADEIAGLQAQVNTLLAAALTSSSPASQEVVVNEVTQSAASAVILQIGTEDKDTTGTRGIKRPRKQRQRTPEQIQIDKDRMAKARAARNRNS